MVYISEWLPNPAGSDTEGEWLELVNRGPESILLRGWFLKTPSGAKFTLRNEEIEAGEYLLLPRRQTKLALRNQNGGLQLYDAQGEPADQAEFMGSAPEGKSFSRVGEEFVFAEPTPAAPNNRGFEANLIQNLYPHGEPLNPPPSSLFWGSLFGSSLILAAFVLYALKKNENLSKLFFGRDQESGILDR